MNIEVLGYIASLVLGALLAGICLFRWRNRQTQALAEEIRELRSQNAELAIEIRQREVVLESMVEGAVAIDDHERLIGCNRAAAEILGITRESAIGSAIQEVLRDYELLGFIREALRCALERAAHLEREISLRRSKPLTLQAYATPLVASQGTMRGVLVVLHDVSQIRRLENIRREFVANVSHELRTPITSMKGFVDVLLEGAIEDPTQSRRFLGIVSRQINSLLAIIEDLLSLSRIEKESEAGTINLEEVNLRELLFAARDVCIVRALEKRMKIEIECDDGVIVLANPTLLEQAVVNLVENALKYSDDGKAVSVSVLQRDNAVVIQVSDQGWGIDESELARIFERFYRVDKGRDRKSGSTGLGLAIVKHVVLAHRGKISVDSIPGKGSRFNIELPVATSSAH